MNAGVPLVRCVRLRAPIAARSAQSKRRRRAAPPRWRSRLSAAAASAQRRASAARGCHATFLTCRACIRAFRRSLSLALRSSRAGASRARVAFSVSAEAPKWQVVKPAKVNVRMRPPPALRLTLASGRGSRRAALPAAARAALPRLSAAFTGPDQRQGLHPAGHPHRQGVPLRQRPALVRAPACRLCCACARSHAPPPGPGSRWLRSATARL